jgi:hypothetical protein
MGVERAMRVRPIFEGQKLAIGSGDTNPWTRRVVSTALSFRFLRAHLDWSPSSGR